MNSIGLARGFVQSALAGGLFTARVVDAGSGSGVTVAAERSGGAIGLTGGGIERDDGGGATRAEAVAACVAGGDAGRGLA